MSVPPREERIRAIHSSLEEWGVDKETRRAFCDTVVKLAADLPASKDADDLDVSDLTEPRIPMDIQKAIEFVIENEIQSLEALMEAGNTWAIVKDKLQPHNFPPFFRSIDRRTGESKMFPNKAFRDLARTNPTALCPFRRFTYQPYSDPAKYLAVQWSTQPAAFEGYVWEALVARWMEQSGQCLHCEAEGCLRWIGGMKGRAWGDAICVECKALYEIKSRATVDKIHDILFKRCHLDSGSYLAFARYRRVSKHKFLIIVSRQPNATGSHPVYGVRIDTVAPRLSDLSFDLDMMPEPKISSRIYVRLDGQKQYVQTLLRRLEVDTAVLLPQLYNAHFGDGAWKRLAAKPPVDSLVTRFQGLNVSSGPRPTRHEQTRTYTTVGKSMPVRTLYDRDGYRGQDTIVDRKSKKPNRHYHEM